MQCLDAWHGVGEDAGDPMERLLSTMESLSESGELAPPMHWDPSIIKKKPPAKQRRGIQQLRDMLVCVRSEAARHGPERYVQASFVLSYKIRIWYFLNKQV
jgi:hypothetical protein